MKETTPGVVVVEMGKVDKFDIYLELNQWDLPVG